MFMCLLFKLTVNRVLAEVRDHGVGFFGFAKDEETRQQQLDALKELRDQVHSLQAPPTY